MKYPRVLVISNNSFSDTSANGRTLGNLFYGWPKNHLAQFCVSSDGLKTDLCDNYFCITDKEALKAFLCFQKARGHILVPQNKKAIMGTQGVGKKGLLSMLIRNIVWGNQRWKSEAFMKWVRDFNPEVLLLFFSDSSFILNIATTLSTELKVPLVSFNTEGFYFFKKNYYRTKSFFDGVLFPVLQGFYKRQVEKTMRYVSSSIYLNQWLQNDYCEVFGGRSYVIYTSSSIQYEKRVFNVEKPTFSYIGNLNIKRPEALTEVADVLQSINPSYKIDVYGRILNSATRELFSAHKGIVYKGFIGYEDVKRVIRESDILFHVESQDKELEESLRYGFSTKIADSVSSGTCFIIYGPSNIACSQYVIKTQAGWFADNKIDLQSCIMEALFYKDKREFVLNNARIVSSKNHNQEKNCTLFRQILWNSVNNDSASDEAVNTLTETNLCC